MTVPKVVGRPQFWSELGWEFMVLQAWQALTELLISLGKWGSILCKHNGRWQYLSQIKMPRFYVKNFFEKLKRQHPIIQDMWRHLQQMEPHWPLSPRIWTAWWERRRRWCRPTTRTERCDDLLENWKKRQSLRNIAWGNRQLLMVLVNRDSSKIVNL